MTDRFYELAEQALRSVVTKHADMIAVDMVWWASMPAAQRDMLEHDMLASVAAAIRTAVVAETDRCAGVVTRVVAEWRNDECSTNVRMAGDEIIDAIRAVADTEDESTQSTPAATSSVKPELAIQCQQCSAGRKRDTTGPGRMLRYKGQSGYELPASLSIPTCDHCGDMWLTRELASQIDAAFEPEWQRRNSMCADPPTVALGDDAETCAWRVDGDGVHFATIGSVEVSVDESIMEIDAHVGSWYCTLEETPLSLDAAKAAAEEFARKVSK